MIRHMDIKLSYACNNNCVHCVVADQRDRAMERHGRDFRTTGEVAAELEGAARRGFDVITFTGGEPTLRKDLPSLVRRARELGFLVGIQTNGRVLSYPPQREALSGMGVRFVIAVHGADADVHDAVTRAQGSFHQTMEALRGLIGSGEKVTGKVVISKLNFDSLPEIAEMLSREGVGRVNFTFPHGLGNAGRDFGGVVPRYFEVMPYLERAIKAVSRADGDATTEAFPLCLLGGMSNLASEDLYRRDFRSEVRQLDQGPRDWSRDRVDEGKSKPASCADCSLNDRCEGVWKEYLDEYGGDELKPVG